MMNSILIIRLCSYEQKAPCDLCIALSEFMPFIHSGVHDNELFVNRIIFLKTKLENYSSFNGQSIHLELWLERAKINLE